MNGTYNDNQYVQAVPDILKVWHQTQPKNLEEELSTEYHSKEDVQDF